MYMSLMVDFAEKLECQAELQEIIIMYVPNEIKIYVSPRENRVNNFEVITNYDAMQPSLLRKLSNGGDLFQ